MNFQKLLNVETSDKYLDFAFLAAKKRAEELATTKANDKLSKSKKIESERITTARNTLISHMLNILKSFPQFDDLPDFYQELVKITIDFRDLKKSLGAVGWALKKIDFFFKDYNRKILRTRDMKKVNVYRREFYGRISSVMKQIRTDLNFLEEVRKKMKAFPNIKTSLKTTCIFGFPNVGKSTLLGKITDAKPEIKNYAFTTKRLNLGTYIHNEKRYQFVDTPGTLDRFNNMNEIEQQAYLALKYCCDTVVYVFDLTESYSFDKQFKLFENLKKIKNDVPVFVYLSKIDLVDKSKVTEFEKEFNKKYKTIKVFTDKDKLVKETIKSI